jgi:glutamate-1-semialdehyde 2,1-aminomutase
MNLSATAKSEELFKRANRHIPGGVNSPVRAFRGVGGTPRFIVSGRGSRMIDADGNSFIDYVGSWGPLILGHAHPEVTAALQEALARGTSFGAPTELEVEMAEMVCSAVKSVEVVRMVNSGTEAAISVIRLARGATGRNKIIKIAGCYHGHADSLLVQAGSGVATLGLPDSPGVTPATAGDTITVPFNDVSAVERALDENMGEVAAVLIEPVAGNMGMVPPQPGYLEGLRGATTRAGALLIFDEVMTGFRVHFGGAQTLYNIEPDLTMFGKVIGGGLPVGAYGGRRELMMQVAPAGAVYQAGTLSGNPLAMTAGLTTLNILKRGSIYEELEKKSARLAAGLTRAAHEAGIEIYQTRVGSMMGLFFQQGPVFDYEMAKKSDVRRFASFFHGMLKEGVYLAPSQFEALFMSAAHTDEDIDETIEAAKKVMKAL